jgi:hypothetical protein
MTTCFSKSWIAGVRVAGLPPELRNYFLPQRNRRVTAVDAYKTQCVLPLKAPRLISIIYKVVFFERTKPSLRGAISLRNETATSLGY